MAEKKEFKNLQMNKTFFMGKIQGEPVIGQTQDGGEYVTARLRVFTYETVSNGQGVETEMIVPLYSTIPTVVNAFKHVVDGHHIQVDAYYKSWAVGNVNNHTFFILRVSLGSKPFNQDASTITDGVMLPPI